MRACPCYICTQVKFIETLRHRAMKQINTKISWVYLPIISGWGQLPDDSGINHSLIGGINYHVPICLISAPLTRNIKICFSKSYNKQLRASVCVPVCKKTFFFYLYFFTLLCKEESTLNKKIKICQGKWGTRLSKPKGLCPACRKQVIESAQDTQKKSKQRTQHLSHCQRKRFRQQQL